jgi:hypothetical protein
MSENGRKRLETWVQVGILGLMIIFHAIATQERIAKIEQQIADLKELIMSQHQ